MPGPAGSTMHDNGSMHSATLDELRSVLGPMGILGPDGPLDAYEVPARGDRGPSAAVVRPRDVEQVREVVRWARRHRIRILPQGANTGLVGSSTPSPDPSRGPQVVLSTELLTPPIVIDPVERTAVVGAGTRLSELNDAAAADGLHLPIDLGSDPAVGGMAATNTGGSRMLAHGDMRRQILGLRFVIADEDCTVVDELTSLRKDNTGPRLWPLLVGSGGALGVITHVAVELAPRPAERVTAWVHPRSLTAIPTMLVALEARLDDRLSAFEVISAAALAAVAQLPDPPPVPAPGPSGRVAMVEVSGPRGVEDQLVEALAALEGDAAPLDGHLAPAAHTWGVRHRITEALARRGTVVGADVSVPRAALPLLVSGVERRLTEIGLGGALADFGHWGDGGVHCNVVLAPDASQRDVAEIRSVIFDVVDELGGSYSAEHGIGPVNAQRWRRTTPPGRRKVLAAVAATVDPLGILGHPDLPYRDQDTGDQGTGDQSDGPHLDDAPSRTR